MEFSPPLTAYLRHVAASFIEVMNVDEQEAHEEAQSALFDALDEDEQATANAVIEAVFGEYL